MLDDISDNQGNFPEVFVSCYCFDYSIPFCKYIIIGRGNDRYRVDIVLTPFSITKLDLIITAYVRFRKLCQCYEWYPIMALQHTDDTRLAGRVYKCKSLLLSCPGQVCYSQFYNTTGLSVIGCTIDSPNCVSLLICCTFCLLYTVVLSPDKPVLDISDLTC